jgi:flagellar motor switch protein FliG
MSMGADRVALLLNRMPPEVVEAVLAKVDPSLAARMRAHLQELQKTPAAPEVMEKSLFDLRELLRSARKEVPPAAPRGALADEFVPSSTAGESRPAGDPPPTKPAAPLEPNVEAPAEDPIAALQQLEPTMLAAALRDEQVPMVALVLSCLSAARACEVIKILPKDARRDVTLKLGESGIRPPELVSTVARAVVVKARDLASRPEEMDEDAHVKKLADLLRNLERDDRKEILDALLAKDPEAAEKVKKLIYLFEDLLRIENRSLQALLSEVDVKTLARALRGASDQFKQKILANLSTRAGETLNEESALLTTVPASTVREAQAAIVDIMQRLDKDGKLVMLE